MESTRRSRPRVSRETRLLLTTALAAVVALWVLARLRVPGLPAETSPVQPILTTLGPTVGYDVLASQLGQVRARLGAGLVALDLAPAASPPRRRAAAGIRLRDDLALTWLRATDALAPASGASVITRDEATGLAVARVPTEGPATATTLRVPRQPQRPRYVLASDVAASGVTLRPVFVGALSPDDAPRWAAVVWRVPPRAELDAGDLIFTSDAELVGLAIAHGDGVAVVPGDVLLQEGERLAARGARASGDPGVRVQALTPALAEFTGAAAGVVVAAVGPDGPARDVLRVGDVIEAADGVRLPTIGHWARWASQADAGVPATLSVRRGGDVRRVRLVPGPRAAERSVPPP